jgi:hypothetical protein
MVDHENDHDHDRDRNVLRQDNEPGEMPISSSASNALASLSNLGTSLANVARASRTGRRGNPLMQFIKNDGGKWVTGPRRIEVEADSQWAINPLSFEWGFIAFREDGKAPEQIMASVQNPMPDPSPLVAKGLKPNEQRTVDLKCCSGVDLDAQVTFCTTTVGGIDEMNRITGLIGDRINSRRCGEEISPVVVLERGGYKHRQQEIGWVATPSMRIVGWQSIYGPDAGPVIPKPEPPPPTPTAEAQPRRRRVG